MEGWAGQCQRGSGENRRVSAAGGDLAARPHAARHGHRLDVAVDLTEDDDEEPAPLALTEEDHSAAQLTALDDGSAVLDWIVPTGRGQQPVWNPRWTEWLTLPYDMKAMQNHFY